MKCWPTKSLSERESQEPFKVVQIEKNFGTVCRKNMKKLVRPLLHGGAQFSIRCIHMTRADQARHGEGGQTSVAVPVACSVRWTYVSVINNYGRVDQYRIHSPLTSLICSDYFSQMYHISLLTNHTVATLRSRFCNPRPVNQGHARNRSVTMLR
jgi:hypothetical protein